MHKGIILICEAKNKKEAIKRTRKFMKEYEHDVYDWWVIGGRWSCNLSTLNKDFQAKAQEILKSDSLFISQKLVDEKQNDLQLIWENMGGHGSNPYADHYKLPDEGGLYDVLLLSECMPIVVEWQQTIKDAQKIEKDAQKWLNRKNENTGEIFNDWGTYGYCLQSAANLYQQKFCFDCNVFNIEKYNYSIPKEGLEKYFAVIVDIHN